MVLCSFVSVFAYNFSFGAFGLLYLEFDWIMNKNRRRSAEYERDRKPTQAMKV
jgi:hypothetical protein